MARALFLLLVAAPTAACAGQEAIRLRPDGAYFYVDGAEPEPAEVRYDVALATECRGRGLLRSAPTLARGMAAERTRLRGGRPDTATRVRYLNEALRKLRIDVLVRADRVVTEAEVRALFERRYGPGGVRDRVRMVTVTFAATRERCAAAGEPMDRAAVTAAARNRAETVAARAAEGGFEGVLAESDSGTEVRGAVELQRYGRAFRTAVAALEPGATSGVLRTRVGFHLVQLVDRQVFRLEEVSASLRRDLRSGFATDAEKRALRRALLQKHGGGRP